MKRLLKMTMWFFLIALVVLVALTQYRAGQRESAALINFPPEGEIIEVDGVSVHAIVRGAGPDLVLIHGASGNARDFSFEILDQLAQSYRVIVFDRPGMGHTGRAFGYNMAFANHAESLAEQAALLQKAAAQLGADKPIVVGQSYGGAVALAWTLNHPDTLSALVLVGAVSNPWDTGIDFSYRIFGSRFGGGFFVPLVTAYAQPKNVRTVIKAIFAPQPVPDGYTAHVGAPLTLRRHSFRANARQVVNLLPEIIAMEPRYAEISLPVEIIHGDSDTIVPHHVHAEVLATQIDGAVLTILPGIGHMPHHVAREAFYATIDRAATRAGLR